MKLGTRKLGASRLRLSHCSILPHHLKGVVEVSGVHTAPEQRGKGYASNLLNMICKEADLNRAVLLLQPDDDGLAKWYEKHGFQTIQTAPVTLMARQPRH